VTDDIDGRNGTADFDVGAVAIAGLPRVNADRIIRRIRERERHRKSAPEANDVSEEQIARDIVAQERERVVSGAP
jgi:hypothetical protein